MSRQPTRAIVGGLPRRTVRELAARVYRAAALPWCCDPRDLAAETLGVLIIPSRKIACVELDGAALRYPELQREPLRNLEIYRVIAEIVCELTSLTDPLGALRDEIILPEGAGDGTFESLAATQPFVELALVQRIHLHRRERALQSVC